MSQVMTNPYVSSVHAANMERELRQAETPADLVRIAEKHGKYLLGGDREAMRAQYKQRAAAIGASRHDA